MLNTKLDHLVGVVAQQASQIEKLNSIVEHFGDQVQLLAKQVFFGVV